MQDWPSDDILIYDSDSLPEIFKKAKEEARYNYLCYVNSDIMLSRGILVALERCANRFDTFLATGRRLDVTEGKPPELHGPAGLDYFIFSKDIEWDMPDLKVGRPGWDNWMVLAADDMGIHTIDITNINPVMHPIHPPSEHREDNHNMKLIGDEVHIGRSDYCRWVFTKDTLQQRPTIERVGVINGEMARQEAQNDKRIHPILRQRSETLHNPLVSIILPTYNRQELLKEAVKSVINQYYENWELIIINDGGEVPQLPEDTRIRIINNDSNYGPSNARNIGLRVCKGRYVAYLDDDDEWYANHLRELVAYCLNSGSCAAYTISHQVEQRELVNDNWLTVTAHIPWNMDFNPQQAINGNWTPSICVMHERFILDEVGLFNEEYRVLEDWDMWLRIGVKYHWNKVPVITAYRRMWGKRSPIGYDKELVETTAKKIKEQYV